ncbi:hypothetical protein SCHPADRAFT_820406 [Schizopora paradoxa]|uniref:Uncharacterized protein n=1 Tax=Schizopora paradoxa TaxID=27342 RepID=A0A0H2SLY7_9AGAM|nr:hypothetical protein SCHPADRAFT_820406 [Schizopora paradoxa]
MSYQARNCFYLRVSATNVIPLYLYLDERHIEWMTDRTLQHVISDLRPLLSPKLKAEANAHLGPGGPSNAKRGTVDVHRGDHYQFAYFLRKADPHAVVLKPKPIDKDNQSKKRKGSENAPSNAKRSRKVKNPRARRTANESSEDEDEELVDLSTSSDEDTIATNTQPRRSNRTKGKNRANYRVDSDDEDNSPTEPEEPDDAIDSQSPVAVKMGETDGDIGGSLPHVGRTPQGQPNPEPAIDLVDDEEEEKVKPILKLHYKGFSIYGRCLCVVVEPYPPMRGGTRAPSMVPQRPPPRMSSIAPPEFEAAFDDRASVPPLFLPDPDREQSVAPVQSSTARMTTPLFSFDEQDEDDEEGFGMMAFSQVLNSVSGEGKGGIDEDDEIDGGVFFGDADENRDIG